MGKIPGEMDKFVSATNQTHERPLPHLGSGRTEIARHLCVGFEVRVFGFEVKGGGRGIGI